MTEQLNNSKNSYQKALQSDQTSIIDNDFQFGKDNINPMIDDETYRNEGYDE